MNLAFLFSLFNLLILTFHEFIFSKIAIYDLNSKNKIHLSGGIIIFTNFILLCSFYYFDVIADFLFNFNCILVILSFFFLGVVDDKFKLNPYLRLSAMIFFLIIFFQSSTSFLILDFNFSFHFYEDIFLSNLLISKIFTIFCILAFLNALNFFDGINLQVAIYSTIILLYLNYINHSNVLIILSISLIFFLYLNFKNISYLGDSGVYFLSIVISLVVIEYHNKNLIYADQIIFLFLIPGLDMIRLFFERISNNKNPMIGDQNHIHHLLKNKFKTKAVVYVLLLCFAPILLFHLKISKIIILTITLLIYLILIFKLKKNEVK